MKRILLTLIALLALISVAAPVKGASAATRTPFRAEASFVPGNVSPGEAWITKGGIEHIMGATSQGTIQGDVSGTFLIVSYETVNLNTGRGTNHGNFVITLADGTFTGSFQSTVTMYTFSGTFVGHGTGQREGQKIMGSHQGILILDTIPHVEMTLEGTILSTQR